MRRILRNRLTLPFFLGFNVDFISSRVATLMGVIPTSDLDSPNHANTGFNGQFRPLASNITHMVENAYQCIGSLVSAAGNLIVTYRGGMTS